LILPHFVYLSSLVENEIYKAMTLLEGPPHASHFVAITTMRSLAVVVAFVSALVALPAFAATQIPIEKYNGTTNGRYIVQMKDGADKGVLQSMILQAVNGQAVTHDWSIINGFSGMLQ
jgi:hypothetical protein